MTSQVEQKTVVAVLWTIFRVGRTVSFLAFHWPKKPQVSLKSQQSKILWVKYYYSLLIVSILCLFKSSCSLVGRLFAQDLEGLCSMKSLCGFNLFFLSVLSAPTMLAQSCLYDLCLPTTRSPGRSRLCWDLNICGIFLPPRLT